MPAWRRTVLRPRQGDRYAPPVLRVAFDVGPLAGHRTGIGAAVAEMARTLRSTPDCELVEYVTSFRAHVEPPTRRLPVPAALGHRWWAHASGPPVDRWLGRPDVVHGTNYVVPPTRCPRVVSVYDCWFLRHPAEAAPAVVRAGEVLRRSVRDGATVHASSHATAAAVAELLAGAKVTVVPLGPLPVPSADGVRVEATALGQLVGVPYVLAIGTIERRKNLPTLVRAFGAIAPDQHDLRLVIAGGDGDDRPALDSAVARLEPAVARRVVLAGRVDQPAKGWLLRHAEVLAYPSLDEGFGFPLLDAMQVGVPIVASDAGSIPEVAGAAALLSAPDDVDALAANLVAALTDDALRERLMTAGATRVVQHSWTSTACGLLDLYRQVSERHDHGEKG